MNPKLLKFLDEYKDMSLIGFAWALYWRLTLTIMGIYLAFVLLIGGFALVFGQ